MRSFGRSTTTTLNVNTNVKLKCPFATNFSALVSFKTMQYLIFLSRTSNFIDDEGLFVLSDLFEWKNLLSARRLFSFQLNAMAEYDYLLEFRFGKRDMQM